MARLRPPRLEGTFCLKDGRRLGYAEYGPASGHPLLWFHGTPGARKQVPPEARDLAYERKIRIIALERPGIGDSTPHAYEAIAQWADDVEAFCDAKGIEVFDVVGLSGGGPYALACAHAFPERISGVAILGGIAPATGPEAAEGGITTPTRIFSPILTVVRPPLNIAMRRLFRFLEPRAGRVLKIALGMMPPGDQRLFEDPATRQMFIEDLVQGSRNQMQAIFLDGRLFGRDWGFSLKDISSRVHMWYGDADKIVPLEHGKHMAELIPDAVFRVRHDEGHLGGLGAFREVIDAIRDDSPETKAAPKKKAAPKRRTRKKSATARKR